MPNSNIFLFFLNILTQNREKFSNVVLGEGAMTNFRFRTMIRLHARMRTNLKVHAWYTSVWIQNA